MTILASIGQWLLKVLLGGIFNKVMSKIEEEAKQKEEAAKLHASSTVSAAATEVEIAKAQAEIKTKPAEARSPDDPFGNTSWNQGVQ